MLDLFFSRRQSRHLPTWRILAVPQVQFCAGLMYTFKIYHRVFHLDTLCLKSKEESGFMAVPLVDKGVVVVAVDYDIAPKGTLLSFISIFRNGYW